MYLYYWQSIKYVIFYFQKKKLNIKYLIAYLLFLYIRIVLEFKTICITSVLNLLCSVNQMNNLQFNELMLRAMTDEETDSELKQDKIMYKVEVKYFYWIRVPHLRHERT